MPIRDNVKRKLWAASGGFCAKPDCHADLFVFFENGEISNIEELAHVIGRKENGPRGEDALPITERDEFENIIILCPTCHTIIDKNPLAFPINTIIEWKDTHKQRIDDLFSIRQFNDRNSIRDFLLPIFSENKMIFHKYGPHSENAQEIPLETENMWEKLAIEKILPNNRTIEKTIICNFKPLVSRLTFPRPL